MGWSCRRSVGVGPFRVNIRKSGTRYSIGGGGFRTGVNFRGRQQEFFRITVMGMPQNFRPDKGEAAAGS
jgi:hypothetical protein